MCPTAGLCLTVPFHVGWLPTINTDSSSSLWQTAFCPLVSGVAPFWARIENQVRKSLRLLSYREKKHPTNWNRDGEALLRNASTHDLETWVQRHGRPVVNTDPACMTCHNSYMDLGPQIASSCICPLTIYMMLRSCVPISWEFYGVCRCNVRGAWVSSQNIW